MLRDERILTRALLGRLFENDAGSGALSQLQVVIWGIAVLAAPGYLLSWRFAIQYGALPPSDVPSAAVGHRLFFVTFGMMALGLVAVLIWEGVFPDRRDVRILGPLPLRGRTHVAARLAALTTVAAMFCFGINAPSAVIYGLALWGNGMAANPARAVVGHVASTAVGGSLTFFAVIASQGLLLNLLGRRLARRMAVVVQVTLIVLLIQTLLFMPYLTTLIRTGFSTKHTPTAAFLPPAWCLSLYDVIAGIRGPVPNEYAVVAAGGAAVMVALAVILLAASYRRLTRMALETDGVGPAVRRRWAAAQFRDVSATLLTRSTLERAVAGYTLRTLIRSRLHLMLLAAYGGAAVAVIVAAIIPQFVKGGLSAASHPSVAFVSAPLVVIFAIALGMRALFAMPADLGANWAFRLYAPDDRMDTIVTGARTALVMAAVVPAAIASVVVGTALWGGSVGLIHAICSATLGVVLVEIVMIGFRTVPFACVYYPARSRTRTLWPLYAIAFAVYCYGFTELQLAAMEQPTWLIAIIATTVVIVAVAARLRRLVLQPPPGLVYDEADPSVPSEGLRLSERLAAEAQRSAPRR